MATSVPNPESLETIADFEIAAMREDLAQLTTAHNELIEKQNCTVVGTFEYVEMTLQITHSVALIRHLQDALSQWRLAKEICQFVISLRQL